MEAPPHHGIGVSGRVVDTSGNGVADLSVSASSASYGAGYESAETNETGAFQFAGLAPGRYEFTAVRSNLSAFSSSTTALSGPIIMNAVPRSNANGLTVPAMFAVKPQFFENGTTTVSVTFTVTAP